jgi:hypothetical protein
MTNAPLEMYADVTWEILDPNTAQMVAVFHDETAAREYLEWRNSRRADRWVAGHRVRRRACEGCNAEPEEPCRWGCLSSVPLDCLIEAIEMWVERPGTAAAPLPDGKKVKRSVLVEAGDYLARVASDYLRSTGATPVAPVIPDREDN